MEPIFKPKLLTTTWLPIHKNPCVCKNAYTIETVYNAEKWKATQYLPISH